MSAQTIINRKIVVLLWPMLAAVTTARAGGVVGFVPQNPGPYSGGETFNVDVNLQQSPAGSPMPIRGLQFDFSASDDQIALNSFDFFFGPLGGQEICDLVKLLCGSGHAVFESLVDGDGQVVSLIFTGAAQDLLTQVLLPGSDSIKVGTLNITLPDLPGQEFLLDALNPNGQPPGSGAFIEFDCVNRNCPFALSGEPMSFTVVPEPATLLLVGVGAAMTQVRFRRPGVQSLTVPAT